MSKRETGRPVLVFARGPAGQWLGTCVWGPALPRLVGVTGNAAGVPACGWKEAEVGLAAAGACVCSSLVLRFCCCTLNALQAGNRRGGTDSVLLLSYLTMDK